jgi:hypothetical protein
VKCVTLSNEPYYLQTPVYWFFVGISAKKKSRKIEIIYVHYKYQMLENRDHFVSLQ